MLYLYWILFFLKNFMDHKKTDVRIQLLKSHKLTPTPTHSPPKRRSDVFRSKIDLKVVPKFKMENKEIEGVLNLLGQLHEETIKV